MKKLLLAIMTLALLVGCQSNPSTESKSESMSFDNYGRKVEISQTPTKVITIGPNCSEVFCELGLEDLIVGNALDNHSRGPLKQYEEAYAKIPELTYGSPTRESVLTSGADFIYGIDWEFGDDGLDVDELAEYGITTYMNRATTLEETYQEITDIGKIFHVEDKAKAFIEKDQQRIQTVENKVKDQKKVKVLVYDSGGNGIFTCSGSNYESLLIEKAGGQNIYADQTDAQWITVSSETTLERQPDVIVIHDYDQPSIDAKIKEIKSDPALSQLDCVKNERFVTITLESVLPGVRGAYSIETLAKGFYPELFKGEE